MKVTIDEFPDFSARTAKEWGQARAKASEKSERPSMVVMVVILRHFQPNIEIRRQRAPQQTECSNPYRSSSSKFSLHLKLFWLLSFRISYTVCSFNPFRNLFGAEDGLYHECRQ